MRHVISLPEVLANDTQQPVGMNCSWPGVPYRTSVMGNGMASISERGPTSLTLSTTICPPSVLARDAPGPVTSRSTGFAYDALDNGTNDEDRPHTLAANCSPVPTPATVWHSISEWGESADLEQSVEYEKMPLASVYVNRGCRAGELAAAPVSAGPRLAPRTKIFCNGSRWSNNKHRLVAVLGRVSQHATTQQHFPHLAAERCQ